MQMCGRNPIGLFVGTLALLRRSSVIIPESTNGFYNGWMLIDLFHWFCSTFRTDWSNAMISMAYQNSRVAPHEHESLLKFEWTEKLKNDTFSRKRLDCSKSWKFYWKIMFQIEGVPYLRSIMIHGFEICGEVIFLVLLGVGQTESAVRKDLDLGSLQITRSPSPPAHHVLEYWNVWCNVMMSCTIAIHNDDRYFRNTGPVQLVCVIQDCLPMLHPRYILCCY